MQQITLRIPEDVLDNVDAAADERGVSRSEYIRERLADGVPRDEHEALQNEHAELQREYDDLQAEHERLRERLEDAERDAEQAEARADDLRRQLQQANARNDDVEELVEYVETERSLQRERAAREREREQAGLLTRSKWWVFGRSAPVDPDEE